MKRRSDELHATNFEFLQRAFPDLIKSIEDGFFGEEFSKGPLVRKTIKFIDGTCMTVFELIDTRTGKKKKYQYDWEYQRGKLWKWHNESHEQKQYQTLTEPDHIHHKPIGMHEERRYPNFGHHDLYTIMESIFMFMEIEKQKQTNEKAPVILWMNDDSISFRLSDDMPNLIINSGKAEVGGNGALEGIIFIFYVYTKCIRQNEGVIK